ARVTTPELGIAFCASLAVRIALTREHRTPDAVSSKIGRGALFCVGAIAIVPTLRTAALIQAHLIARALGRVHASEPPLLDAQQVVACPPETRKAARQQQPAQTPS